MRDNKDKALIVKDVETYHRFSDIQINNVGVDSIDLFSQLSIAIQRCRITFTYSGTNYDDQGIVYWLGTNKGQNMWANPQVSGHITITTFPNLYEGYIWHIVNNKATDCVYTDHNENSYYRLDFRPSKIRIRPTAYTLGYANCSTYLRSWVLEGSNDDDKWDIVKEHVDDSTLVPNSATWKIESQYDYSIFKIRMTGPSVHNNYYLVACGVEIYGHVHEY
jgi:hypothetical protein